MRTASLAQGLARSCAFYFVGTLNWDPAVMDSKVGLPLHREVDRLHTVAVPRPIHCVRQLKVATSTWSKKESRIVVARNTGVRVCARLVSRSHR
jgi:hypothetical protein